MSRSVLTLHPSGSLVSADGCLSDPGSTDLAFSNISTESASFRHELDSLEANTYDEVRISDGYMPDDYVLEKVLSALRPLGKLLIRGIVSREVGQNLSVDLKIQGFLDIMVAKDPVTGDRFAVCQKPAWLGDKAAVKINVKSSVDLSGAASNEAKRWKMDVDDLADSDLIDEDALLDRDFRQAEDQSSSTFDCGEPSNGGKKRACKDCTCGLAERQTDDNTQLTVEDKIVRSSACGSCYKGDAFRCASCPFLGKPAFEPGSERVVLATGMDDI